MRIILVNPALTDTAHFPLSVLVVLITGFIAAATLGSLAWFRSERFSGWKDRKKSPQKGSETELSYDPGIVPAETAARLKREGKSFMQTPKSEGESDTTSGYTLDREGLMNNYAIEPKMYINKPGDLKKKSRSNQ
jgi:hypothetical protein